VSGAILRQPQELSYFFSSEEALAGHLGWDRTVENLVFTVQNGPDQQAGHSEEEDD